MAKKKSARGTFNMSEAVRELLQENSELRGGEVYEALRKKYPGQKFNRNSLSVAYSNARRKLGIRRRKTGTVRVRRPGVRRAARRSEEVNLDLLKTAGKFLKEAGSAEAAIQALQQVASLQVE